ncbi:MAG: helix-turn-helix domain-containing protein [Gemmataceae bacterium]
MPADKLLLDVREVAALLGCSDRAVWGWSTSGKFPPPLELGRLRKWRRVDVEAWLEQKAQAAAADQGGAS